MATSAIYRVQHKTDVEPLPSNDNVIRVKKSSKITSTVKFIDVLLHGSGDKSRQKRVYVNAMGNSMAQSIKIIETAKKRIPGLCSEVSFKGLKYFTTYSSDEPGCSEITTQSTKPVLCYSLTLSDYDRRGHPIASSRGVGKRADLKVKRPLNEQFNDLSLRSGPSRGLEREHRQGYRANNLQRSDLAVSEARERNNNNNNNNNRIYRDENKYDYGGGYGNDYDFNFDHGYKNKNNYDYNYKHGKDFSRFGEARGNEKYSSYRNYDYVYDYDNYDSYSSRDKRRRNQRDYEDYLESEPRKAGSSNSRLRNAFAGYETKDYRGKREYDSLEARKEKKNRALRGEDEEFDLEDFSKMKIGNRKNERDVRKRRDRREYEKEESDEKGSESDMVSDDSEEITYSKRGYGRRGNRNGYR